VLGDGLRKFPTACSCSANSSAKAPLMQQSYCSTAYRLCFRTGNACSGHPKPRGGYDAIEKLGEALSTAMPYIEWPLGHYERQTRPKRPKAWHTMALIVARLVIGVMVEAGHNDPGISRNSVVARVVRKALIRMNFSNSQMITLTAIAAHLTRWDKKYGLTAAGIAALTTK
jgi:hypothetical protein